MATDADSPADSLVTLGGGKPVRLPLLMLATSPTGCEGARQVEARHALLRSMACESVADLYRMATRGLADTDNLQTTQVAFVADTRLLRDLSIDHSMRHGGYYNGELDTYTSRLPGMAQVNRSIFDVRITLTPRALPPNLAALVVPPRACDYRFGFAQPRTPTADLFAAFAKAEEEEEEDAARAEGARPRPPWLALARLYDAELHIQLHAEHASRESAFHTRVTRANDLMRANATRVMLTLTPGRWSDAASRIAAVLEEGDEEVSARNEYAGYVLNDLRHYPVQESGREASRPWAMRAVLRRHQLQNLRFMLDREARPSWREFWFHVGEEGAPPVLFSPVFNAFVREEPRDTRGGWLCDDMGLGKTISVLALACASVRSTPAAADGGGTLIICPVSLLHQWRNEIERHTRLRAVLYHGPSRHRGDVHLRLCAADVVVTSASIIASEYARWQESRPEPLARVHWHRIVVDEAHLLKADGTQQAQGLEALRARARWCVTGTPFANYSLQAQARFLRMPLGDPRKATLGGTAWCSTLRTAFRPTLDGWALPPSARTYCWNWRLRYMLNLFAMRHYRRQVLDGFPIEELPQLREETVQVTLSTSERATYDQLLARTAQAVRREYVVRLRALLDRLLRFLSTGDAASAFEDRAVVDDAGDAAPPVLRVDASTWARLTTDEDEKCAVCLGAYEQLARTACNHHFCFDCIMAVVGHSGPRCPLCRSDPRPVSRLMPEEAEEVPEEEAEEAEEEEDEGNVPPPPALPFTKIARLVEHVAALRRADPTAKILIFTAFDATVVALSDALGDAQSDTIRGSMAPARRARSLRRFAQEDAVSCLLLTTRTAAAGINLTAANHIIIFDVQWQRAMEEQVVGRAWRMGQRRDVTVWRYITAETVESRLAQSETLRSGASTPRIAELRALVSSI